MKENYRIERQNLLTWMVKNEDAERVAGIDEKCTIEYLQAFLDARVPDCTVVRAEIDPSGIFQAKKAPYVEFMFPGSGSTIPVNLGGEYAYVEVQHKAAGSVENICFILPTIWNGRYFGMGAGGVFTNPTWEVAMTPELQQQHRLGQPNVAALNGFATSWTDSGLPPQMMMVWDPADPETGAFNEPLLRNYDYLGMHTRTVIAKMLIEALTGEQPAYSYSEGGSGGGRVNLRFAQRCPEDYDGIWADCPYHPFHECSGVIQWAMVVMKDLGYLPFPKLEAFRNAALESVGGLDEWMKIKERIEFDARECIGTETEAGPITETDAKAMNLIWEGPRRKDGTLIRPGWRPGAKMWGRVWWVYINDEDGNIVDIAGWDFAHTLYGIWVKRDPSFDWHTITMDTFEDWYDEYYRGFASWDLLDDDADLSRLVRADTKLMITQGTEDEYVTVDGTIDYYDKVVRATFGGSVTEARKNARLFLCPGNDHTFQLVNDGVGPCFADGMIALMKWVEEGKAPDYIPAVHIDFADNTVDREGEVVVY